MSRSCNAVPAAAALLILALTLRPFDFRFAPDFVEMRLGMVDRSLLPTPDHESLYVDAALNVLLFLPFGFTLFAGARRAPGLAARLAAAGVAALFLSTLCEGLQIFLPKRHPQAMDVAANTLGALAGAAFAAAVRWVAETVPPEELRAGAPRGPAGRVAAGLLLLLLLHPAVSLDPVRSVRQLEGRAKAFVRSPWFGDSPLANAILPVLLLCGVSYWISEWAMARFPSLRRNETYLPVLLVCLVPAVAMPIPRIFFRWQDPDWGSIAFGATGAAAGILLHRLRRTRSG